jgi:hypothetical protein
MSMFLTTTSGCCPYSMAHGPWGAVCGAIKVAPASTGGWCPPVGPLADQHNLTERPCSWFSGKGRAWRYACRCDPSHPFSGHLDRDAATARSVEPSFAASPLSTKIRKTNLMWLHRPGMAPMLDPSTIDTKAKKQKAPSSSGPRAYPAPA